MGSTNDCSCEFSATTDVPLAIVPANFPLLPMSHLRLFLRIFCVYRGDVVRRGRYYRCPTCDCVCGRSTFFRFLFPAVFSHAVLFPASYFARAFAAVLFLSGFSAGFYSNFCRMGRLRARRTKIAGPRYIGQILSYNRLLDLPRGLGLRAALYFASSISQPTGFCGPILRTSPVFFLAFFFAICITTFQSINVCTLANIVDDRSDSEEIA